MTLALRRVALLLGLPAILVATWWFTSVDSINPFFPPLSRILTAFRDTWSGEALRSDVMPSLSRLGIGYAVALVLGVGLGVLIGSSRWLRSFAEPVLEFLRAVPPPILVPVIILMAGIGDLMKVIVIVSGALWPILLNTVEGVRGADEILADTCRSYRIRAHLRLRHFVLRAASPQIMTGARQALAIAIILMVISEFFASSDGLGYLIVDAQRTFLIPVMWSGVLLLGIIGIILALLFRLVESRILNWYHGVRAAERGTQ